MGASSRRLNIGALDWEDMAIHTQEYETINADATSPESYAGNWVTG